MRYRKDEDNRYRVRFMRNTEELMDRLTVNEFIAYLEENAELEDEDFEYIEGKVVAVKYYELKETDKLRKEFIVTEDGRVFYWISLNTKAELIDDVKEKEEVIGAMSRKSFLFKVMKCMKGFATAAEIKEEYDALSESYSDPQKEMIDNITEWLRFNFGKHEPENIIWERLEKEHLIKLNENGIVII